jgi:hypothetical protein
MMARVHHMRAIVLKNHYDSTAPFVTLVRRLVPGIEIYGGIDLNLPVGGMNAAAVEHMTQILGGPGRFVWMSTYDAENQVRFSNRPFVGLSRRRAAPDDDRASPPKSAVWRPSRRPRRGSCSCVRHVARACSIS